MSAYQLFSTEGCHLCEEAEALLIAAELDFSLQDILNDPQAYTDYSLLIPVLVHSASQRQLNWPFDQQALHDFIKSNRL